MTDAEIDEMLDRCGSDTKVLIEQFKGLSLEDRERLTARVQQRSRENVQKKFAEMEADGSMDEIRKLHARDQEKGSNL